MSASAAAKRWRRSRTGIRRASRRRSDFLADFGFRTVRRLGRVELARLELGGLIPVEEKRRARLLGRVRELLEPELAPVPRRP